MVETLSAAIIRSALKSAECRDGTRTVQQQARLHGHSVSKLSFFGEPSGVLAASSAGSSSYWAGDIAIWGQS
jgi:hypothetical protein